MTESRGVSSRNYTLEVRQPTRRCESNYRQWGKYKTLPGFINHVSWRRKKECSYRYKRVNDVAR